MAAVDSGDYCYNPSYSPSSFYFHLTYKMAPVNQPSYSKDEKVLCFHHELLYEAKVLDSKHTDEKDKKSPMQYRVHYKGWKNT